MIRNIIQSDHEKVPNLAFHTMNLCDDYLVIYGGMTSIDKTSGDLIFLKLKKSKFLIASYESNKKFFPEPRHSHSAVYFKEKSQLLIFGGITNEKTKYSDQLWTLQVASRPVFELQSNTGISPRCRHVNFIHKGKLYIYGGFGVNKITKKLQVLNDLHQYDLSSRTCREISTKGGVGMNNYLFKIVKLTPEESDYEININYDLDSATFTKVKPKFFVHQPRENFIVEKLSDGRIVLFGGTSDSQEGDKLCYNEAFILDSFYYSQGEKDDEDFHYTWTDLDLFNLDEKGYNGHASVVLKNDHILIFGGSEESFLPIYNYEGAYEELTFTKRFQVIDVFKTYKWEKPDKLNSNKLNIYPRILHVSHPIKRETQHSDYQIFFHGGEYDDRALASYSILNLSTSSWWTSPAESTEFVPQIKSHACSGIYDPERKEHCIIITGGLVKEHMSSCEAHTNKQKERCVCNSEFISDKIYSYRNHEFSQIEVKKEEFADKLKRIGHNMLTGEDNCIYVLCGFAQFVGYLVDIIKLTPKTDTKKKVVYFEAEILEVGKTMPGRMNATSQIVRGNIIVFGGLRETHTLNDLWVINLISLLAVGVDVEPNWIYPRFGMSSILYQHDNSLRFIIFGGSFWAGKTLIYGVTNEIITFNLKFTDQSENDFEVVKMLPMIYGKGARRIFHQAFVYENNMCIFGGPDNLLLKLELPFVDGSNKYSFSLNEYTIDFPLIHFTNLVHSQTDDRSSKFDYSENRPTKKSKVENHSLNETSFINTGNSVSMMDNSLTNTSHLELISIRKNQDGHSDRSISQNASENSILLSSRNLLSFPSKKVNTQMNRGLWDKDYK